MTPFLLGTRNRWDYFLLTCALIHMALWTLYEGHGIMHGPRYWYEAMPFLMLLAARGVESAAGFMAWAAAVVRHRLGAVDSLDAKLAGYTITHSVLALLVWYSLSGWLLGSRDPGWSIDFVPNRASALRGFNGVDEEFVKFMKRAPPDGSLVLIEQCPSWHCYGLVFGLNSPFLDSDVVFARNIPARNRETFEAFPGRHVFIAKYRMKELRPYGSLSAAE